MSAAFVRLWLSCASVFLSIGISVTLVPRYVTGELGGSAITVGLVTAALAVGACAVRPLAGRLADSRGRRWVAIAGALVCLVAGLLLIPDSGLAGVVASRVLLGIGQGAVFTAGLAWADDLAAPHQRGRLLGLFGLSIWLSLAVGPVLGELALTAGGFDAAWLLAALSPLLGATMLPRGARSPASSMATPTARREPRALLPQAARRPGTVIALASTGHAALGSFAVLMLEARGISHASLVFSAFAGGLVVARLLLGGLPDRVAPERCAVASGFAQACGLAVLTVAPSLGLALGGAALFGAGYSLMYPSLALMVVRDAPDSQRGAALGAFTGFYDLGMGTAAPAIGAAAAVTGYAGGFSVAIAAAAAATVVVGARREPHRGMPRSAPA